MPRTAIFSDIDGTLLDSAHQVTPRTRAAIEAVQRAGVPFVIVTARGISGTYPLLEQQGITCTVVTYSGGVILDEACNVIHHHGLTRAQAQEVVDFAEAEHLPMTWSAYSFEDWVAPDASDPRLIAEERIVMAEAREGTIASIERDEVQKILCLCTQGETAMVERRLKERFPEFAIAVSSETLIEVMPAGSSKAGAVRTLCELWDLDPADAIAFGDNYNDLPMLEAVGRGYLMGNAPVELLAAASLVAPDNDHDGVARVLESLGLAPGTDGAGSI